MGGICLHTPRRGPTTSSFQLLTHRSSLNQSDNSANTNHSQSAGAHLLHELSSYKRTNLHEALTTVEGDIDDFNSQYEIGGSLGEGITGEVRKVRHRKTGKEYAMKSLNTHVVNDRQLRELKVEIEVLRHLDHPNVVRLVQTFNSKSEIFLIMEECTGGDLRQLLSPHTTPGHRRGELCVRHVMCQIVQAIAYCHYHGIVHRDLKLENVLFTTAADNQIKIVDFGFAALSTAGVLAEGPNAKKRLMQTTCGSTYYLAPEMLVDGASYSEKVDIWSIGVMAYKILMKHCPFDGSTEEQVLRSIRKNNIDFDVVGWKRHSSAAKNFVMKCLTTEPEVRPSAKVLLETADWLKLEEQLAREQIDEDFGKQVVASMLRFQSYPKLKQVALSVVANHWAAEAGRHNDVKAFLDFFVSMDEDHSGELTKDELEHVVKRWPTPHLAEPNVENLFLNLDQDHSGKIGFSEWLASVIEARNIDAQSVDAVFDHLDSLHDGDLSVTDLKSLLHDFSEEEISTMIEQVPSHHKENGELVVSRVEFLDMMFNTARPMLRSPRSTASKSPQSSSSTSASAFQNLTLPPMSPMGVALLPSVGGFDLSLAADDTITATTPITTTTTTTAPQPSPMVVVHEEEDIIQVPPRGVILSSSDHVKRPTYVDSDLDTQSPTPELLVESMITTTPLVQVTSSPTKTTSTDVPPPPIVLSTTTMSTSTAAASE